MMTILTCKVYVHTKETNRSTVCSNSRSAWQIRIGLCCETGRWFSNSDVNCFTILLRNYMKLVPSFCRGTRQWAVSAEADLCSGVKLRTFPSCSGGSTLTRLPYTPLSSRPPACGTLDKHKQKHRREPTYTHIPTNVHIHKRNENWTPQDLRPQLYTFPDQPTFILSSGCLFLCMHMLCLW